MSEKKDLSVPIVQRAVISSSSIMENNRVQELLKSIADRTPNTAQIIESANGAGMDYKSDLTWRFIKQPDGTEIVERVESTNVSVEPNRKR